MLAALQFLFFPPLFLQIRHLLCLREPIECVSVCNKLLLGATGPGHAEWKTSPAPFGAEQAKEGDSLGTGAQPGSGVRFWQYPPIRRSHVLLPALPEHSVPLLPARDVTMNKYNCQIKSLPGWDLLSIRHTFWAPKSGQGIDPRKKSDWSRFTQQISFGAIG